MQAMMHRQADLGLAWSPCEAERQECTPYNAFVSLATQTSLLLLATRLFQDRG